MNILDFVIIVIVALCAWGGFRRGLIRTVYRLVSFFVALFVAHQLYPYAARFLRETQLFPMIRDGIARAMNLQAVFNEHTAARGAEIIDRLPLPGALRAQLHLNNTPDMFELLRVATVEEYISSFFANMVINAIAILAVFVLAMVALAIVGSLLDIVGMLPVIRTLNRVGGLAVGLAIGAILVWVGLVAMTLMFAAGVHPSLNDLLQGSVITAWIFDNEFILPWLTAV